MSNSSPIYSSLATDPVLGEIVELFVAEMPARIETLRVQAEAQDRDALRRTAHQLKGALGSHGFNELTPAARRLESLVQEGRPEPELAEAVEELAALCERLESGQPAEA
jgi:histidine phosphotransfer protein HptB